MLKANIKRQLPAFELKADLEVKPGEVLGIMGPSGCGKSMLLKCIAGLEECFGIIEMNEICWLDSERKIFVPAQMRQVGFCFQNYALFEGRSVLDNVALAAMGKKRGRKISRKEAREKAKDLLEQVGLAEAAGQYPATLSGGQKQRAALARLMADEPVLLLLDEPFSAIDGLRKKQLYGWLKDWLDHLNIPVILCSHDPQEIKTLCTRTLVMEEGHFLDVSVDDYIN